MIALIILPEDGNIYSRFNSIIFSDYPALISIPKQCENIYILAFKNLKTNLEPLYFRPRWYFTKR